MASPLRIALPDSLRLLVERSAPAGFELPSTAPPAELRGRERWQRLWRERRAAHGASSVEAEAALQNSSLRPLFLLLEGRADALLLDSADAGFASAWGLLEPADAGLACADLWIGDPDAQSPGLNRFGWWSPATPDSLSASADQFRAASAALDGSPVLVLFAGGKHPWRPWTERFLATLRARTSVVTLDLYSPLFYGGGRLQARAWLEQVRRELPKSIARPVLCVPQLQRTELAHALTQAGGAFFGPFRAGAECPAAALQPDAPPPTVIATLEALARLARPPARA